jgi:hypothetical protein
VKIIIKFDENVRKLTEIVGIGIEFMTTNKLLVVIYGFKWFGTRAGPRLSVLAFGEGLLKPPVTQ